ncbi:MULTISPECIES: hypothetical protein [Sorangium]|uniref:hypothetical protein n=1 Tax=Sorangium TaxID=39643 RepID=UPI00101A8CE5|nr:MULTISPECIES: hypothetical protein [Sorangium]
MTAIDLLQLFLSARSSAAEMDEDGDVFDLRRSRRGETREEQRARLESGLRIEVRSRFERVLA